MPERVDTMLDAVERWATGYWLIRETGIVDVGGRLDGLLVPMNRDASCMESSRRVGVPQKLRFFARPVLLGVEVKVTRADFLRGLREGQYDRYAEKLGGLYVAVPRGACRVAELPDGVGLLVAGRDFCDPRFTVVCRRNPTLRYVEMGQETFWRLLFTRDEEHCATLRRAEARVEALARKIGRGVGNAVSRMFAEQREK